MSSRATSKILLITIVSIFVWHTVGSEARAQPNLNQNALRLFVEKELGGPIEIVTQRQSRTTIADTHTFVALLCRTQDEKNLLLVIRSDGDNFQLVWSSTRSLGVITPKRLQLRTVGNVQFFTLLGCNPHDCGGASGSYTAEVFQVSDARMNRFEIWGCESSQHLAVQSFCVSSADERQPRIPSLTKAVIEELIHDQIAGASGAVVHFKAG